MVWMYQRFNTENCETSDGRKLRILHPGFWNNGPGPDFRSAVISIHGEEMKQADIEIDVKASYWHSHRHDLNPAFNKVRLHVIWKGPIPPDHPLPVLKLSKYSPENEAELLEWSNEATSEVWPEFLKGKCAAPLSELDADTLQILTRQASLVRLRSKTRQIEDDAKRSGFENALWQHLVAGLGYQNNQWPMRQIANMRDQLKDGLDSLSYSNALLTLQARLLGVANLLPKEIPSSKRCNQSYLKNLWDIWWRDRDKFESMMVPVCIWSMQGIRPANQPTRRLATVAHWMLNKRFFKQMEDWFNKPKQPRTAMAEMSEILGDYSDEFWSWHWSLKGDTMKKPAPLVGSQRTNDLVINVILPWFLARVKHSGQEELKQRVERLYLNWPRLADNRVLKSARQRLLRDQACRWIKSAAHQQGILQIVRDFCNHSNATCEQCLFPEVARSLEMNSSA